MNSRIGLLIMLSLIFFAGCGPPQYETTPQPPEDSCGFPRPKISQDQIKAKILSEHPLVLFCIEAKGADLSGVNVSWADFVGSDLSGADFAKSILQGADFRIAELRGAGFYRTELPGASFSSANLTNARFYSSNLRRVNFNRANLEGANFSLSDLTDAIFTPRVLPRASDIAYAHGLGHLRWSTDPSAIYNLRKAFVDAGLTDAARQVNAAIRRHFQTPMEKVLFDWTCEWGANFLRPLELVAILLLVCTAVYTLGVHFGTTSGLYLAGTGERIRTARGKEHILRIVFRPPRRSKAPLLVLQLIRRELKVLSAAFLFSLMSVFNIGFKDVNFGLWIRLLQPREFDIRARGWMRTVSGVQALLAVALIGLSLLSYFGHPFDIDR